MDLALNNQQWLIRHKMKANQSNQIHRKKIWKIYKTMHNKESILFLHFRTHKKVVIYKFFA